MTATISIVTPSLNTADALERTLLSIVTQAGDFRLRVHVQDGGSNDGTLEMLARWQARLADMRNPILCRDIWFTYASSPTTGVGAAIDQGIAHISGPDHGFTSWIRPGDVYLSGALGYVAQVAEQFTPDQAAWISGSLGILRDHRLAEVLDIPMPSSLLALGLANGQHWPFQQQQGTFFRRALWTACHKAMLDAPDSLLGEWALWQDFARQAPLIQAPHALGAFRPRLQHRPLHRRIQARRQMIAQATAANPKTTPEAALQAVLHRDAPVLRHILRDGAAGAPLRIDAEDVTDRLRQWLAPAAGAQPCVAAPAPRTIATGQLPDHAADRPPLARLTRDSDDSTAEIFPEAFAYRDLLQAGSDDVDALEALAAALAPLCQRQSVTSGPDPLWRGGRIWGWDLGWHTAPATEWRAFRQVQALLRVPQGTGYLGFPWASVMGAGAQDTAGFDRFCAALPPATKRITVCQHPDLLKHLDLLQQAGVTDVFWPYVTTAAHTQARTAGLCLHPFAHCPTATPEDTQDQPRPDMLADMTKTTGPDSGNTAQPRAETSLFALCPHGVGGNSLALWQAIAAGAIPVILTETAEHLLSSGSLPGDPALWETAVLLCPAKGVAGLPDRLRQLADTPQHIEALHQGLRQVRLVYGPQALTHDIQALMAAQTDQASPRVAAPARIGRPPRLYGLGLRFGRTPLGYAPLRRLAEGKIDFVTTPDSADLILTGWNRDFEDHAPLLSHTLRSNPSARLAVISEEPLWDTVWSGGYAERDRIFDGESGPHPYRFLNHFNSDLFDFTHLPYFLLTADHYCARYVSMLAQYAHVTPRRLRRHWQDAPHAAAFAAEFRSDPVFDVTTPDGAPQGLSGYRTRVAQLTPGMSVLRMGKGWPEAGRDGVTRQNLPDWHLDKLARLDGQVRLCSAYENTHHSSYISEKLFDAFAVGGIPVCYAGPEHRLHDLVLPGAMVNSFGLPPEAAAEQLAGFSVDLARAEAWLETAAALRDRLGDSRKIAAERQRVVTATLAELYAIL